MILQRLRISTKLWSFILLVIGLIASVALVGLVRSGGILGEGREAQLKAVEMVQISSGWLGLAQTHAAQNQSVIFSSDTGASAVFKNSAAQTDAERVELEKKFMGMPLTDADRSQLQKVAELRKSASDARDKVAEAQSGGKADIALQALNKDYLPTVNRYFDALKELIKLQEKRVVEGQVATEARRQTNTAGILIGLAFIVGIILVATGWLVGSIRAPLAQANELAARIAQGDLSSSITTTREDEFGQLLTSLSTMNDSLEHMVSQVRESTEHIAIASAEIATGNNDLAQRTEQTSSDLQATASSMDELTETVRHSSDNARQASALAASASTVAQRGGEVVSEVVRTMQEIDMSSKRISDIIGVIDGIAFQTNILALNAAVEAARAGEQGRGFAVVASEVRSLAQRSAEAAKEIKGLINTSVEKVESGTRLVNDAGTTMADIVQSVRRVADVIGEITSAAAEQSSGIAGVNQAINNLDQMTQQNAALVEESAAAAESLREQADRMKQSVAVFKVSTRPSNSAEGRTIRKSSLALSYQ